MISTVSGEWLQDMCSYTRLWEYSNKLSFLASSQFYVGKLNAAHSNYWGRYIHMLLLLILHMLLLLTVPYSYII